MAGLNHYIGWGISTFLLHFLNKGSNSVDEIEQKADALSVSQNETKIGEPIPVVLGRGLIKSPIVSYFGDFDYRAYTETYAAHAEFNAWPLVLALIAQYIAMAFTGHSVGQGQQDSPAPVEGNPYGGQVSSVHVQTQGQTKDDFIGPLLNSLFLWLLSWLINGRNLKTTVQKGFKYYLGYQFLVAWSGKKMRIRRIYMNDKSVWSGDVSRAAQGGAVYDIRVDNENLFGGVDEGGGFVGNFHVYLGGDSQGVDAWMVSQMNAASVQEDLRGLTPAYRPFVSIVVPKAYIGKQATIPETWIELQNCPDNLGLGQIGEDANPAEIIYEILTNNDWGLAESADNIDRDALIAMGETLKEEGIGLSVRLDNTEKAQDLIDNICAHINAVRFADPHTGKTVFKLIRDDYNVDEALILDETNCSQVEFTRLDWTQIVSKISVAFTSAANKYEEMTVPTQDPAAIEINNGVQTVKSYDYTYFTEAANALWAAKRELMTQAYPLAAVSITANRAAYDVRIGDVIVLNWKPYGIKNMVVRVTDVDIADFVDGSIKIEGMEDIWGLTKTEFSYSGSTEWKPDEKFPDGVQDFKYMELPYEIINDAATYVASFAARPSENTAAWTVWRQPAEGVFSAMATLSKWTPTARLVYGLDEFSAVEDVVGFEIIDIGGVEDIPQPSATDIENARRGSRIMMIDDEIIAYSNLVQLPNGHWQAKGVLRGAFDTVPAAHNALATVFFITSGTYQLVTGAGAVVKDGTTTESYNIVTESVDHIEDFDYTKVKSLTTKQRSALPSVPGRIRLSAHNVADAYTARKIVGDLSVSFVPRNNRQSYGAVSQDDEKEYWTRQDFAAYSTTDYLVRLSTATESKDFTFTGSPAVVTWEDFCNGIQDITADVTMELYARNGELLSYQPQTRNFQWRTPTLADIVPDAETALARLAEWGGGDRIVIPAGDLCDETTILYENMPIFLLGEEAPGSGVYGYDGLQYAATGKALIVKADGTIETEETEEGAEEYAMYKLKAGFTFNSYFVPGGSGGSVRSYEWDGEKLIERA